MGCRDSPILGYPMTLTAHFVGQLHRLVFVQELLTLVRILYSYLDNAFSSFTFFLFFHSPTSDSLYGLICVYV